MKSLLSCALLALLPVGAIRADFVRVNGAGFVGRDGKPLAIKGTNLGNWLVPEGCMWRLKGGPESPREIEALVEVLLGPDKAAAFCFADLLQQIALARCTPNRGYIEALGLSVPETK